MIKTTGRIQQIGFLMMVAGALFFLCWPQRTVQPAYAQGSPVIHQESEVVSGGSGHTCAITSGGGLKCWGQNTAGQLGTGNYTSTLTAADVVGLSSGVVVVSAGESHTCAVTSGGSAKCWGLNTYGQLGYGSTTSYNTPVDVVGLDINVTTISVGTNHACALTNSGGVQCWGYNGYGQLGDGTTTKRLAPVPVVGLSSGVAAISAGDNHTCAIMSGGGAKCWGQNNYGQLGDGTTTGNSSPVDVTGLSSGVISISAGVAHTCVLTNTGGIKCWGLNGNGQLGDGMGGDRLVPTDVAGSTSGMASVGAGSYHTCASTVLGRAKCWGSNGQGRLGDGNSNNNSFTPVDVTGLNTGVVTVSLGGAHSCALMATGVLKCWGYNSYGRLGDGTTIQRTTPVDVLNFNATQSGSMLAGRVIDQHGAALVGFTVILDGVPITQSGSVGFRIADVSPGQHTVALSGPGYTFDQSPRAITIPYAGTIIFIGIPDETPAFYEIWDKVTEPPQPAPVLPQSAVDKSKEPLIILHGIQYGKGYECAADNGPYLYKDFKHTGIKPLGELAAWFEATGKFEIWIAMLDTSLRDGTPSIQENAKCLQKQVEKIFEAQRVDNPSDPNYPKARNMHLIAHSMGGLVARSCIASYGCYFIKHLYTLGTPHGGVVASSEGLVNFPELIPAVCTWNIATCQFSDIYMKLFNQQNPNLSLHHYTYIGGYGTPDNSWYSWITSKTEGEGDGIVSKYSAIGLHPKSKQPIPNDWRSSAARNVYYWTNEVHSQAFFAGHDYYSPRDGQASHAFECLRYDMGLRSDRPGFCATPTPVAQASRVAAESTLQQTMPITGVILAGETITRQLQVDTDGQTQFVLTWLGDSLTWTLRSPSGQHITPSDAAVSHLSVPAGVTLPFDTYLISNTIPGLWQLQITNPSSTEAMYGALARFESSRLLSVQLAHDTVAVGSTQEFTATLQSGAQPITGAALEALIYLPEETVTLKLNENSPGLYRASYQLPLTSGGGIVNTVVQATGLYDNVQFHRQQQMFWIATPKYATLAGVTGHHLVDTDSDQQPDRLELAVGINVSKAATYTVIAHVSTAGGTLLATGSAFTVTTPGAKNLTIALDATPLLADAQSSFIVSRLFLLEVDKGDIPLDEKMNSYSFEFTSLELTAPSLVTPENNITVEEGAKLTYQWQAVPNAASYNFLQTLNPESATPTVNQINTPALSYTDQQPLIPGLYQWAVKAVSSTGIESITNHRSFAVAPHNPANMQAAATSCQTVVLSWDDNSNAEVGYHIYRNNAKIGELAALNSSRGEYQDGNLASNTTYEYKVVAYHPAAVLAGVTKSIATPACDGATFALTTNTVGSGTISASTAGPYPSGTQVQLTATPAAGWRFVRWESTVALGNQATQPVITVTVTTNATYTAHFVLVDSPPATNTIYLPFINR